MHRTILLSVLAGLAIGTAFAGSAAADEVSYVIPAMGVGCNGTAAGAERVVMSSGAIKSVEADPKAHTVTAIFDDETITVAAVVDSLEAAGYSPGEPRLID